MAYINFIGWWSPAETVTIVIRRKSDGYYLTAGEVWQAGAATIPTTEDNANLGSAITSAYYSGIVPNAPHVWVMKTAGGDIIAGDPTLNVDAVDGHTPQTGDNYARLGTPAGASISADLLVIDNFVDALETRITAVRAGYLDELAAANIPADLDGVKAVTDVLPDAGALTTLITHLTDIKGTGFVKDTNSLVDLALASAITALNDISATEVNTEVVDALFTDTISELTGDPGATPTPVEALMLIYMALRNLRITDNTTEDTKIHNDAGVNILTASITDTPTTFTKSKFA